jgi:hypothetical protein
MTMRKMTAVAVAAVAAAGATGEARIRQQSDQETGFLLLLLPSRWKDLLQ